MQNILACIDASAYASPVCDLAAWASKKLEMPVELLHVVQRRQAVAERRDLSGAIGLGTKSQLLEELTQLEETSSRLEIERGRILLEESEERLRSAGAVDVKALHRHGGIVETILEREEDARLVVIGKRGASQEFATGHIGSKVERVVRASKRPVLVASRESGPLETAVLAFDGSPAARRALERCANSPLFDGLSVHVVVAGAEDDKHRRLLAQAVEELEGRDVATTLEPGRPDDVIASTVNGRPGAMLVMGAYGHSPLRNLIVGSTTTTMIRTIRVPVLLVR